ncbi:glycerophosphodiester phosphodiesterase [Oceanobacillus sp. APA_J-5(13-2)]|nr:glycerophosphodiester phosphodiesterase [Oceanobacillus alkalisoli]MCF3941703.1 glycerophosphodiester phosphodiesterase [Oceanobacillus alkalisoli]MCG5102984.1 glycerophosphodiester phosphodiesterase [Oceanobacillus alkalisoli]
MQTMIFAHRGASKYAPENTLPAFRLAYQMEADGIETDIQLTKDGIPILIHDEDLRRTTNGRGHIKDYHLEELKTLDAGAYFAATFIGTRILTLEEFLEWASDKPLHLNLELKNNKIDYEDIEIKVLDAIRKYQVKQRTTISSFNPESVKRMRQLDHTLDVAFLRSGKHPNLADYAKELGASSLHVKHTLLTPSLVKACEAAHLPIRVYTVNRTISIKKCLKLHCSGIITDVPDKAHHIRNIFK